MKNSSSLIIQGINKPTRLDRVIRDRFPEWGRKAVQSLITSKKVKLNGRTVWLCSWKVNNGDRLEFLATPEAKTPPPSVFDENWIIAEEGDLIAVNKPAGLLSHATKWNRAGNLLDLATERFGDVSLFHRLDRDTSGVVLLTRSETTNAYLDSAFKNHTVKKEYIALIPTKNSLDVEGVIRVRIAPHQKRRDMMTAVERGGKLAVTRYKLGEKSGGKRLIYLWPETGRTHQLRVHLLFMGAPILGDRLYGSGKGEFKRLMLHAQRITLPADGKFLERIFTAPLPEEFVFC